jgi:hypothetical protein
MRSRENEETAKILEELDNLTKEDRSKFEPMLNELLSITFRSRHRDLKEKILAKAEMFGMIETLTVGRIIRHIERGQRIETARVQAIARRAQSADEPKRVAPFRRPLRHK